LITSTKNPSQLKSVTAVLEAIVEQVRAGKMRWHVRTYLADALRQSGRADQSLVFYEEALKEAEEAGNWSDVGWICGNWANALGDVGKLQEARDAQMRSADAERKAGSPEVNIVGSELEAFRIDVMQGKAEEALPEIGARLKRVRTWYKAEEAPEASDRDFLERVLIGGLNIAYHAHLSQENWQECLNLLEETEEVERARGAGEHEIARTRFNRYFPLIRLQKLTEAKETVEGCLEVYKRWDDLTGQSKALYALSDIWDELGDLRHAIELARQALSVCNSLPNPEDRAISHGNLSVYLHKKGNVEEGARHLFAGLVYYIVTGNQQRLGNALRNLSNRMQEARQQGREYPLPKVRELLAGDEFITLRGWLEGFGVDADAVQGVVDKLVGEIEAGLE
jgi:tetratricopeptide (TPR) repeat protein